MRRAPIGKRVVGFQIAGWLRESYSSYGHLARAVRDRDGLREDTLLEYKNAHSPPPRVGDWNFFFDAPS